MIEYKNLNSANTIPVLITVSLVADAEAWDGPAGLVVQIAHVYDHGAVLDILLDIKKLN